MNNPGYGRCKMRKSIFASFTVLIVLLLSGTVYGLDGERKGFVLAGGVGPGYAYHNEDGAGSSPWSNTDSEDRIAILSNFKMGYAPTNQIMILYSNVVAWYETELSYRQHGVAAPVTSVVVQYYTRPNAPSFLFGGGIGGSSMDCEIGIGACVEVGYEYTRHINLTFHILYGKPGSRHTTSSAGITLNLVGY